jgi:DNA-binding NarL/FixJ family response regulator
MATRILIADDHTIMRTGLRALLEKTPGCEIVGEAADGKQAVALAGEFLPDIVIMDVNMPVLNGIEATKQILAAHATTRVIVLSAHSDANLIRQSFHAGAVAYLLKDAAFDEVVRAIEATGKGEVYVSSHVAGQVMRSIMQSGLKDAPPDMPLSPREREVLQLVADGKSTKQVAQQLTVSVKTIETHRQNIMAKLNLFSVAELTKYAIRRGLTSLD